MTFPCPVASCHSCHMSISQPYQTHTITVHLHTVVVKNHITGYIDDKHCFQHSSPHSTSVLTDNMLLCQYSHVASTCIQWNWNVVKNVDSHMQLYQHLHINSVTVKQSRQALKQRDAIQIGHNNLRKLTHKISYSVLH